MVWTRTNLNNQEDERGKTMHQHQYENQLMFQGLQKPAIPLGEKLYPTFQSREIAETMVIRVKEGFIIFS